MRLAADLRRAWRDGGVRSALQELREALIYPLFRHGRLLVIEQTLEEIPVIASPDGVTIRSHAGDDFAPFAAIAPLREVRRFERAARAGRTCLVARRGDRVVGYTWISDRIDPRIEIFPVPLPSGQAYGWNLFVTPAERSGGLGAALIAARMRHAQEMGFSRMRRVIDLENAATRRTVQKTWGSRSRVIGELHYRHVLGRSFGKLAPARGDAERAVAPTPRDRSSAGDSRS